MKPPRKGDVLRIVRIAADGKKVYLDGYYFDWDYALKCKNDWNEQAKTTGQKERYVVISQGEMR